MNIISKFLVSITLISSVIITGSTFAKDAELLNENFVSAVKKCNLEEMQGLIEAGADVNASIPYSFTMGDWDATDKCSPLLFAIRFNKPEMATILLQVKNKLNTTLNQALDEAIKFGCSATVEELIKEGADINYIDEDKNTLLILAVKYVTPLQEYTRNGGYPRRRTQKVVQVLLNQPKVVANLNHVNKDGRTALMEAAAQHDLDTVQNLLKFSEITTGSFFGLGEKPINCADKDGNTALTLAIKNSREKPVSSRKIIQSLLKAGANINHANKDGRTPLIIAIQQHDLDMVQALLKSPQMTSGSFFFFGEKPINYANENGNTALIIAIKNIQTSFVYSNRREYNYEYNRCQSSQKIVETLLKTPGIDPYRVNKKGETAIALLEKLNKKYN